MRFPKITNVDDDIARLYRIKKRQLVIAVFPYLFFNDKYKLNGIEFKNSDHIPNETDTHIKSQLNLVRPLLVINKEKESLPGFSYVVKYIKNEKEWKDLILKIKRIVTAIRFTHFSVNNRFNYEAFNFCIFAANPKPKKKNNYSFDVVLNGETVIWLHYPEEPYQPLSIERTEIIDTQYDLNENKLYNNIIGIDYFANKNESSRIINAIDAFNRSERDDFPITKGERIILRAIAFESLLINSNPEDDKKEGFAITNQLKASLTILLGDTENKNLSHWFNDFYKSRSQIVHGNISASISYADKDQKEVVGNHLTKSKPLFIQALNNIILLRRESTSPDQLEKDLISNSSRLTQAAASIKKLVKEIFTVPKRFSKKRWDKKILQADKSKIFDTIEKIHERDPSGSIENTMTLHQNLMQLISPITKLNRSLDKKELTL